MRYRAGLALALAAACASLSVRAQDVSREYQVKAAYLYNFVKFIEWPADAATGPLLICVARPNPFGTVLDEIVKGDVVGARPIESRVIGALAPECRVLFVPRGAAAGQYLRAAAARPVLTVGETDRFIADGGIAAFYIDGDNVRFAINPAAADRAMLRISSRLLKLARLTDGSVVP